MNNALKNTPLYDDDMRIIQQSTHCIVYRMEIDGVTGIITNYQVFPGISLMYNDFHTGKCPHHSFLHKEILEINYCREGRFECEFVNGMYTYLGPGDLAVNTIVNDQTVNAAFPLEHYQGISILVDIQEAAGAIFSVLTDISIDLYTLRDRLCANNRCFIIRAKDVIQHIFAELYTIPDKVKSGYIKLKVLELLLFLSTIDASEQLEKPLYFPKSQVNKIKQIKQFLLQHIQEHYTLEALSNRFDISLTTMKTCFKAVYGMPVYAFIRTYRMQAAATMLRNSTDSITVIAGKVGYDNSSKFASAFRAVMHNSPSVYRKLID